MKMPFFKSASSLRSDSSDADLEGIGNFQEREEDIVVVVMMET